MAEKRPLNRMERRRNKTREKIIRSGRELFIKNGYHATSIANIMEHADLGHGTFYQYFENKKELFLTMIKSVEERIEEKARLKIPKEERDIQQRIYIGILSVLQVYYEYQDLLAIIRDSMSLDEDFRQAGERIQQIIIEKAVRDYHWCNKHGLCRNIDTDVATLCIVSMIQGAGDQIIFQPIAEEEVERIAKNMSEIIFHGLFTEKWIPKSEIV